MYIFEIKGVPVAQMQTRVSHQKFYDPSKKSKEYIQWQIKPYAPAELISSPVCVDIWFYLPIPKNTSNIKRQQMINHRIVPIVRPDIDNLAYLVTNAMKGIVYVDDNQIVDQMLHKRYCTNPRTVIKIEAIETGQKVSFKKASCH